MDEQILLLKIDDILKLCNISRRYFQNLRHRGRFPEPTLRLGRMAMWHRETVEAWARGEWQPEPRLSQKRRAAAATK